MIGSVSPPPALNEPRRNTRDLALRLYTALGGRRGCGVFIAKQLGISAARVSQILRRAGLCANIRRRP